MQMSLLSPKKLIMLSGTSAETRMNFFQKVGQAQRLLNTIDYEFGASPQVQRIAQAAYKSTIEWFGVPQDPRWPYKVVQSAFTGCAWGILTREYTLHIGRENTQEDQLCSAIGHEMYHRVTGRRKTLRREVWIDELLAFSVQQRFLNEQGFKASAMEVEDRVLQSNVAVKFDWLRQTRRKRILFGAGGVRYPDDFPMMICRLALALDHLLEWPLICALANVSSLSEWYAQMGPSVSPLIEALLTSTDAEVTEEKRIAPLMARLPLAEDMDGWLGMTQAYQLIGHQNASEFLLRRILRERPEQPKALCSLANLLAQRKQYAESLPFYEQALECTPEDAWIRRNYGVSLYGTGKKEQAREQWQMVVEQEDEEYSEVCTALLAKFR